MGPGSNWSPGDEEGPGSEDGPRPGGLEAALASEATLAQEAALALKASPCQPSPGYTLPAVTSLAQLHPTRPWAWPGPLVSGAGSV